MLEIDNHKTIPQSSCDIDRLSKSIRALTIDTIYKAGSGHCGPSLSMVEIVATLLFKEMDWQNYINEVRGKVELEQWQYWQNPKLGRDRFILSKGHAVPSWYSALAVGGYIENNELMRLRSLGSRLQGHPDRTRFPFIDATTGSLGQGQSEAMGFAIANKLKGNKNRVYCIIGDGESDEGQVWETALAAPKFDLDNLVVIVDMNKKQGEGATKDIMDIEPAEGKWQAFNWHVQRVNGHNIEYLLDAFQETRKVSNKPHVIIADTIKGYMGNGQLFMGGQHNPVIDRVNYEQAMKDLLI